MKRKRSMASYSTTVAPYFDSNGSKNILIRATVAETDNGTRERNDLQDCDGV